MRQFIFKSLIFVCVVLLSLTFLLNSNASSYVKKFNSISHKFDIINLGTSHGNAFYYEDLEISGGQFNRSANTIYYDLQNYKYLKPHLSDGALVIIPLSYFSFGLDENRTDNGSVNSFVNDFYYYLPNESIYAYTQKRHLEIYLNTIRVNFFNIVYKGIKSKEKGKSKKQISKRQSLIEHSIKRANKHKRLASFTKAEPNIVYLSELINDAIANGYQPIFVTVPYFDNYNANFEKEWLKEHYFNYLETISKLYEIPYLNYSNDERFSSNVDLFSNSDHLNRKGSIYFSEIFFKDLKNKGLLK